MSLSPGLLTASPPTAGYAVKAAAVMVDGNTIFTVAGGPILIQALVSLCVTANGATASTLQYQVTPDGGAGTVTISAASGSLANAGIASSVSLIGTALSTAAVFNAFGANLGMTAPLFCPAGTITMVIGTGSTTGTWQHHMYYWALGPGITVI